MSKPIRMATNNTLCELNAPQAQLAIMLIYYRGFFATGKCPQHTIKAEEAFPPFVCVQVVFATGFPKLGKTNSKTAIAYYMTIERGLRFERIAQTITPTNLLEFTFNLGMYHQEYQKDILCVTSFLHSKRKRFCVFVPSTPHKKPWPLG